jgi:hypothetical protein
MLTFQPVVLLCGTLQDLINCTPTGHPDYDTLQKTLIIARQFLEAVDEKSDIETGVSATLRVNTQTFRILFIHCCRKLGQLSWCMAHLW